jgi:hypothetical protein
MAKKIIKLGTDGFPAKGLSQKKQEQWLADNPSKDPMFEYRFYMSQVDRFLASSLKSLYITCTGLGLILVFYIFIAIFGGVA